MVRKKLETLIPGARAMGVNVPELRTRAAELRREHRQLPLVTLANTMDAFAAGRVREEILLGAFWLARYGRAVEGLPWRRLAVWLPALDNWETCDQLAMNVAAPGLYQRTRTARRVAWKAPAGDPYVPGDVGRLPDFRARSLVRNPCRLGSRGEFISRRRPWR